MMASCEDSGYSSGLWLVDFGRWPCNQCTLCLNTLKNIVDHHKPGSYVQHIICIDAQILVNEKEYY